MGWRHKQTVAPTAEPLTELEVKTYARVEHDQEDDLFLGWIKAARQEVERITGRQLVTATWRLTLDAFPEWEIRLPKAPVQSVTSITYVDENEAPQTLSASLYELDSDDEPAQVRPAYGEEWPTTLDHPGSVVITYVAGYGAAAAVPEELKLALRSMVAWRNENREEADWPEAFAALVAPWWHGWMFPELDE